MAWGKEPQMFTGDQLTSLLTESETCADVLDFLVTKERQQTELTLSRPGLAPDYVIQMVLVLLKASQCKTNEVGVIDLLTILVGSKFFMCELVATSSTFTWHTEGEDALRFIDNLVEILHQVHQLLPNLFNNAFSLIIILKKKTEDILMTSTEEQRQRFVKLSEKLSEMRDNVMKVLVSCPQDDPRFPFERQAPPDDFRNIPILPRVVDIFLRSRGSFLRKNKSRGGYDDLNHYLDVQFRLLREDCICPLREGITQYVQETSTGCHVRQLQNGRLYRNVIVKKHGHYLEEELFQVTLDSQHAQKINWKSSKRLLHGSLLCFSADNFHTMEFAVVESPDRQMLAVSYIFPAIFPTFTEIQLNTKYTMVESSAFFESYRHVLEGLQSIEKLPLEQYIVDCKNSMNPPRYLQNDSSKYDLEPIASDRLLTTALDTERKTENNLQVRLHDPMSQWPTADVLHLDQSQYVAYHAALTQEFVLIQGPPGTGKTHVGIQIVKTLLHNKNGWSQPSKTEEAGLLTTRLLGKNSDQKNNQLLVVCFTNHALDQFLEGIVGCFEGENKELLQNEIVRVGNQCKNPTIDPFSLKYHKKDLHCDYTKLAKLKKTATQLHTQLLTIYFSLRNLQTTILEFEILRPAMSQRHANAFVCDTPHASSQKLYQWLQAGKGPWIKKASQAYKKSLKTTKQPKHDHANRQTAVNQDFIDTEADKAEEERRIDDDDLHLATHVKIGLDIKEEIQNILKPKHEYMPQIDDALKSFLKQEADITLSKLCSVNMMRAMEVKSLRGSLNKLKLERRWRLYRFWVDTYKKMQLEKMPHVEKEHLQIMKDYKKEKKESDARIFKKSTVIAMTTTGAAQHLMADVRYRVDSYYRVVIHVVWLAIQWTDNIPHINARQYVLRLALMVILVINHVTSGSYATVKKL
ncbi:NFX1-type zinc finger-containing protein 1 [Mizuhopecten yessoensis]|uniref:NFX1-type zinc finger-containing protein 1 n=1 Tax=Mizuhopecten yessoensis TaxID=6573 RepID=A0A210PHJ5_MIZYE|nr:NFX1-type zinc finger-containing protein 1 [Mizuhopecten yessoensis]